MSNVEFNPQAAFAYARANKIRLPRKAKDDDDLLLEVVEEGVVELLKDIPEDDRFECDRCGKFVQEPDLYCWHCGADVSGDGTGGWPPRDEGAAETAGTEQPGAGGSGEVEEPPEEPSEDPDSEEPSEEPPAGDETEEKEPDGEAPQTEPEDAEDPSEEPQTPAGEASEKTLAEYTAGLIAEDGRTGLSAFLIGRDLLEIKAREKFRDGGHDTLEEYVVAELGHSWKSAMEFIRIASSFSEKQSRLVGVYKLHLIAGAKAEHRPKLLKDAQPVSKGGKGLTREALRDAIRDLAGGGDGSGRSSPPKKTAEEKLWKKLVGGGIEGRAKDNKGTYKIEDSESIIHIEMMKTKFRISMEEPEAPAD
jgi:hypothetical protein